MQLALKMGRPNVDGMLEEITSEQWLEWQALNIIEPFTEWRDDYRSAMVCSILANSNRDPKQTPQPYQIDDFMLKMIPVKKKKPGMDELRAKILAAFGVKK